jgi:hypothetical protein
MKKVRNPRGCGPFFMPPDFAGPSGSGEKNLDFIPFSIIFIY